MIPDPSPIALLANTQPLSIILPPYALDVLYFTCPACQQTLCHQVVRVIIKYATDE